MLKTKNDYTISVFQAMPLPCMVLKPEGNSFAIIDVNERYLELVQSRSQDLLGKTTCQAFPRNPGQKEKGRTALFESLRKVVRTGLKDNIDFLQFDIPVRGTREFEEKHWNAENIPVFGTNGEVDVVLHVVNDLTPQVLAEKENEKIELQQRHFIDNNPDGLYSLGIGGRFTSANEGLAGIAEVPLPELLRMDFLPFCHPEDQEEVLQYFHKALAGETVKFEAKFISAMGRHMILQISLLPMRVNGKVEGAYGIAKDLTSIRESEKLVVEKNSFLQANASFISRLLENELEEESLGEAFAIIGRAVAVDRMYYFAAHTSPDSGQPAISQKVEWASEKATPQINNPELQNMSTGHVQQLLGVLKRNQPFIGFPNTFAPGKLRDHFLQQNIKSLLLLPVFLKNDLYGFIGFDDCTRERQWSKEEITFLQSLAHNLTTALEKRAVETALKEREEALLKSERKFKALVQEGSDMMGVLGYDGRYTFVSETVTVVLGLTPEDFLGRNFLEFVHPEEKAFIEDTFSRPDSFKRLKLEPIRLKHKSGEWRWVEVTVTNLLHDPAVNGIVTNARDVTIELNQAREIERINERYRLAATATQDLMYDWNLLTDNFKRFHKTASFLGYPVAVTNERSFWLSHIHPDEVEDLTHQMQTVLNDRDRTFINTKYRMKRADGTYAHFLDRAYIIRDSNGKAIRLVGATSDVSDITAKKQALKAANQRFKMAMKASNEMIWDWDIPTDRVKRSKAFRKVYGYGESKDHPMNNYWMNKIHSEERDSVRSSLSAALKDPARKKWHAEYGFIRANGEIAHIVDRGYILRDESGKAIRMVGSVLDVTASRNALKRIEEQNRRLKEIAWEQSHVVRAPLARILGLLPLVKTERFEEMSYDEIWEHIEASAKELDEIIRKIVNKTEGMKM